LGEPASERTDPIVVRSLEVDVDVVLQDQPVHLGQDRSGPLRDVLIAVLEKEFDRLLGCAVS
jgi:hypothetical protein